MSGEVIALLAGGATLAGLIIAGQARIEGRLGTLEGLVGDLRERLAALEVRLAALEVRVAQIEVALGIQIGGGRAELFPPPTDPREADRPPE